MEEMLERWRRGDTGPVWRHCCSFLDLSLDEFMAIQTHKWKEQMARLCSCPLGSSIVGDTPPADLDEFRERVPFTTYDDYEPYLTEHREDVLPEKPLTWMRTSGQGGRPKWIPLTRAMHDVAIDSLFAAILLATAKGREVFSLRYGDILFCGVAPPPWGSGVAFFGIVEKYGLRSVPTLEQVRAIDNMGLRAVVGFQGALKQGLHVIPAIPSVLAAVGDSFDGAARSSLSIRELRPAYRILKGMMKSRIAGRPMFPKDVWNLKGVMTMGADLQAFESRIEQQWGKRPHDMYVNVEFAGPFAMQTWTRTAMTPMPHVGLLEFIPDSERARSQADPDYKPATVLLDRVSAGERYELVFTSFNGGVMVRYRPGDMIKIESLRDEQAGVDLPQLSFWSRADKLIDIGGFTRLDEKTVWSALEEARVPYQGWIAAKEAVRNQSILHVYVATQAPAAEREAMEERLHAALKKFDSSYADLERHLSVNPLRLTFLPPATLTTYDAERQLAGADPGHMKELHMQPPEEAITRILQIAEELREATP